MDVLLQVTDYAIARRIVDLHSKQEESIDRVYSTDEIQRYLLFARQFKPKVARKIECIFLIIVAVVVNLFCKLLISINLLYMYKAFQAKGCQKNLIVCS